MDRNKREKWVKQVKKWYHRDGKRNKGRQPRRWEDELKVRATYGEEKLQIMNGGRTQGGLKSRQLFGY